MAVAHRKIAWPQPAQCPISNWLNPHQALLPLDKASVFTPTVNGQGSIPVFRGRVARLAKAVGAKTRGLTGLAGGKMGRQLELPGQFVTPICACRAVGDAQLACNHRLTRQLQPVSGGALL